MASLIKLDRADYGQVQATIKRLWKKGDVEYSFHAVLEMDDDAIDRNDIGHVIKFGKIVEHEEVDEVWRYTMIGKSVDGFRMKLVVEINGHLVIVTVFLL